MDDDKGLGIGTFMVLAVLALVGLWVVWGVLGFLFAAVKGILTLALVAAALYGVYRLLNALDRSS